MTTNEPFWANGQIRGVFFVPLWRDGTTQWSLSLSLFVRMEIFKRLMKLYKPAHTVLMRIYWGGKNL